MISGVYQKYQVDSKLSKSGGVVSVNNNDFEDTKMDKREERRRKAAGGKTGGGTQVNITLLSSYFIKIFILSNFYEFNFMFLS